MTTRRCIELCRGTYDTRSKTAAVKHELESRYENTNLSRCEAWACHSITAFFSAGNSLHPHVTVAKALTPYVVLWMA